MIENGHIRIYPAGQEQMERFILAEKDDELKKAYCEMLEGCPPKVLKEKHKGH